MDYEKKYKEALEWARKVIQGKVGFVLDEVLEKFPELKESDGGRINEWLINLVKGHIEWLEDRIREQLSNGQVYGGELVKAKNSLAWLEKQGEKSTDEDIKEALRTEYEKGRADAIAEMQKSAWSEEDKKMCQDTIDWFEKKVFPYALEHENPARANIKWLKSLKDRYTWKPSDEQMSALEYYMHALICNEHKEILFGLYADLKKLK